MSQNISKVDTASDWLIANLDMCGYLTNDFFLDLPGELRLGITI